MCAQALLLAGSRTARDVRDAVRMWQHGSSTQGEDMVARHGAAGCCWRCTHMSELHSNAAGSGVQQHGSQHGLPADASLHTRVSTHMHSSTYLDADGGQLAAA